MQDESMSGRSIAALLLQSGCVSLRGDEPFRLPSGWTSPVYIDCRRLIAFPQACRRIVDAFEHRLRDSGVGATLDGIVAGESSGIAFGAWIAERLDLPLHYVRKRPRGGRQLEGDVQDGQRLLLVDDMMAAGSSKLTFLRALGEADAIVENLLVIFDYATFGARELLLRRGVRTHALATWADVLETARENGPFTSRSLDDLVEFLADPADWSARHGGLGAARADDHEDTA